jgi:putative tricarboxylic transport membrane protein
VVLRIHEVTLRLSSFSPLIDSCPLRPIPLAGFCFSLDNQSRFANIGTNIGNNIRNGNAAKYDSMRLSLDRLVLILFIVLGGGIMAQSVNLSLGNFHNPGPGFMPFILGFSMILLSLLSYVESRPEADRQKMNLLKEEKPILLIFGGLILYLFLMNILGFYVSTFLLLMYLIRACGLKEGWRSVWISAATVIVVYVVFYKLFIIPFPEGVLGI